MWTRKMIKGFAKHELRQSYWVSFAVCLVASLIGAGGGGTGFNFNHGDVNDKIFGGTFGGAAFGGDIFDMENPAFATIMAIIFAAVVIGILIGAAISIFLSGPVEAGKCSFFSRAPYGDRQFSNLFSAFKSGRYMSIVKTMFLMNLYIFLWGLLFIIPGIVKSYQYRMVPYIISDDPSLTPSQAMDLSRRMTDGEKFNMFILQLSFIGWYLLGLLALGLGILFVTPYVEATWAQLYLLLRTKVTSPPQYGPAPQNQYGQYPPESQLPPGM